MKRTLLGGAALLAACALNVCLAQNPIPVDPTGRPVLPTGTQVTLDTRLSPEIKPLPVLTAMQRVADWQLAHPSAHKQTDWTQGAGDAGMMALAGISGDAEISRRDARDGRDE